MPDVERLSCDVFESAEPIPAARNIQPRVFTKTGCATVSSVCDSVGDGL